MKIATWNINSLRVRLGHVLDWLQSAQPDVLALQETKLQDADFPGAEIEAAGYQVRFSGQKTYNGVALLSRHEPSDLVTSIPGLEDPQRRVLAATIAGVRVINLYVPNGQRVDSEKYHYKLDWLNALRRYLGEQLQDHDELVVLGDFNIAPEDRDVHDPHAWEGHVLVSPAERESLQSLLRLGLNDTFRLFEQAEKTFSWWDYRLNGFRRNRGLRIDLVLASNALAERCNGCSIDTEPRGWERPSDHTPVFAEFAPGHNRST